MRLIRPKAEYIPQGKGLEGLFSHIEKAGRICYASEPREGVKAEQFVDRLKYFGHLSVLEHGTLYLSIHSMEAAKYVTNPYSVVRMEEGDANAYITTNYRVIVENHWEGDLKYMVEPTRYHIERASVLIDLPISISREFVRHRAFSFSEQSTRYCNFSKDRFGKELTFVQPYWYGKKDDKRYDAMFELVCSDAEGDYLRATEAGMIPQQARDILPLCTATRLFMTGTYPQWDAFFRLRTTDAAHPDARNIALMIKNEISWKQG